MISHDGFDIYLARFLTLYPSGFTSWYESTPNIPRDSRPAAQRRQHRAMPIALRPRKPSRSEPLQSLWDAFRTPTRHPFAGL